MAFPVEQHEQHRHRSEVRWCITKGREWFERYVKGVSGFRGAEAAKRLWDDVRQQAQRGNTGKPGEWVELEQEPGK